MNASTKYILNPITVEVIKYDPSEYSQKFLESWIGSGNFYTSNKKDVLYIKTKHGTMAAHSGEVIVKVKNNIFIVLTNEEASSLLERVEW